MPKILRAIACAAALLSCTPDASVSAQTQDGSDANDRRLPVLSAQARYTSFEDLASGSFRGEITTTVVRIRAALPYGKANWVVAEIPWVDAQTTVETTEAPFMSLDQGGSRFANPFLGMSIQSPNERGYVHLGLFLPMIEYERGALDDPDLSSTEVYVFGNTAELVRHVESYAADHFPLLADVSVHHQFTPDLRAEARLGGRAWLPVEPDGADFELFGCFSARVEATAGPLRPFVRIDGRLALTATGDETKFMEGEVGLAAQFGRYEPFLSYITPLTNNLRDVITWSLMAGLRVDLDAR